MSDTSILIKLLFDIARFFNIREFQDLRNHYSQKFIKSIIMSLDHDYNVEEFVK